MDINKLIHLLSELAIFVKVVELGSFSQTAKKLGSSTATISRSITHLEETLAEKLLVRTTRKMRLTPTGQEVFILSQDMLKSAHMAVSAAQSNQTDISGSLTVAAPKALAKQVMMPMIIKFVKAHPNVSFHFKVTDHFIDPISDEVDILIHITEHPREGLISRTLGECRLMLCANNDYIEKYGLPDHPEKLINHNCISLGEDPKDRVWHFQKNEQQYSCHVNGSLTVNHSEIRREAVLQGLGISIFPDFVILPYIKKNQAVEVLQDWHLTSNYKGVIVAQYAQSKFIPSQLKVFVNFLINEFNAL
jgi:DNA-binding transcriptional LysR family regulator